MDLAFLYPLYAHTGPWASVYLDLSASAWDTPGEREAAAASVARELAARGADATTCRAVREAVEGLRRATAPQGRALFARAGQVVLDPPLARPPRDGTSVHWAPLPHVAPLVELAGEDPVCLVAYVDREGADFEVRGPLGGSDAGGVRGRRPTRLTSSVDWSRRRSRSRVATVWEHLAAEIAGALAGCREETGADLIILVGDERERRAVGERLPDSLREVSVEAPRGAGGRLPEDEVRRLRDAHVRARARADLDRFLSARATGGEGRAAAVEGVAALVEAAREHRIDELLIIAEGPDTRHEVWIGEDADQVAVHRTELTGPGGQGAWQARADDALLRSAVLAGAPALSLTPALGPATEDGPAVDVPAGGLGALLRER